MKSKKTHVLSDSQRKFAKRWMIAVSAFYGLALLGVLALIVTGNISRDDSEGTPERMAINELDEFTVPVMKPERSSQAGPADTQTTVGVGNAQTPMKSVQPARAAIVPVPEVDEMDEDIHLSSGNGSGPSPQTRAAIAAQSADVLVENGWDFTAPDGVPGFGPMPQPGATPSPDERRRTARTSR